MFDKIVKTLKDLGFNEVYAKAFAYTYEHRNGTKFEVFNGVPSFVDPNTNEEVSLIKTKTPFSCKVESVFKKDGEITQKLLLPKYD